MTETQGTPESLLPIVVGVESSNDATALDADALVRRFLERLTPYRECYRNSRFVMLVDLPADSLGIVHDVANASGIAVVDSAALQDEAGSRPAMAACCHILIQLPRLSKQAPVGDDSMPASSARGMSILGLESESGPMTLRLGAARVPETTPHPIRRHPDQLIVHRTPPDNRYAGTFQRTDDFNQMTAAVERRYPAMLAGSIDSLALPSSLENVPQVAYVRSLFAASDTIAMIFQAKVRLAFRLIFALATVATIVNGVFLNDSTKNPGLRNATLLCYLALLVSAYLIYFVARRRDIHDYFVQCRTLAETSRIQCYWTAAGVPRSAADSHLFYERKELNWIRVALQSSAILACQSSTPPAGSDEVRRAVLMHWIESQRDYYSKTFAKATRRVKWTRMLVGGIFVIGGIATVLGLLHNQLLWVARHFRQIGIATIFFPAVAASISAFLNKIGLTYQADHYSRMLALYSSAASSLVDASMESSVAIAMALGDETLREIGDWAAFRRDRTIVEPLSPFKKAW